VIPDVSQYFAVYEVRGEDIVLLPHRVVRADVLTRVDAEFYQRRRAQR
jgi:hypothetical protein